MDAGPVDAGDIAPTDAGAPQDHGACTDSVCTADYPCQLRGKGYSCRGQFADWPLRKRDATPFRVDSSNGTVTDTNTGLTWQRYVEPRQRYWEDAKRYCQTLPLAGGTWRLPTKIELESLVDDTRGAPTIDLEAFPDTVATWYWTSSSRPSSKGYAWYIYFRDGYSHLSDTIFGTYVRCVRSTATVFEASGSGDAPPGRYETSQSEVVLDTQTRLIWQRAVGERTYTQQQAVDYCRQLSLAGYSFRLPTRIELLSIVNPTREAPSIDQAAFPNAPSAFFWTASRYAADTSGTFWTVSFTSGGTTNHPPTMLDRVRCVSDAALDDESDAGAGP